MKGGRGLLGDYPPGAAREAAARRDAMLALLARAGREAGDAGREAGDAGREAGDAGREVGG